MTPSELRALVAQGPAVVMVAKDDHIYRWKRILGGVMRHGQSCRVTARGRMNSIRVEFADGWRAITSRNAVRRAALEPSP